MSLPQLTASRLQLADQCPGSHAHEHVATSSEAAERGSQVHEYIASVLSGERPVLPKDEKAAGLCARISNQDLHDVAKPARTGLPGENDTALHVEAAMYLSPTSLTGVPGEGGLLEGEHHRDYSGAPEGALVGTADAVAVEEDRVKISDWKTGSWEVPDPASNHQLRFLGLAAARIFSKERATVQVARIAASGEIIVRDAELSPQDLEEIATDLQRVAVRVEEGRAGDPEYRRPAHSAGTARRSRGARLWPVQPRRSWTPARGTPPRN